MTATPSEPRPLPVVVDASMDPSPPARRHAALGTVLATLRESLGRAWRRIAGTWAGRWARLAIRWEAPTLRLTIERDGLRAVVRWRGRPWWVAAAAAATPAELDAALQSLVQELGIAPGHRRLRQARRRTVVELGPPIVQLRTLSDLPPVAARRLDAVVAHQSRRFFRLAALGPAPHLVRAAWTRDGRRRVALAAAVSAEWVETIEAACGRAGLGLRAIEALGCIWPWDGSGAETASATTATAARPVRLRFASSAAQSADLGRQIRRLRSTAALAAALTVGTGGLAVERLRGERAALDSTIARLGPPARAVAEARREVDAARAMVATLETAAAARGTTTRTLALLTEALPDSAYLHAISWDSAGGALTGVAPRAADVLAALDRAQPVANPRLDGAPVREMIGGGLIRERFTIRFDRERH